MIKKDMMQRQIEELTSVNKGLHSFVYSVSHNLRAPLMSILGLISIAKKEDKERDAYFNNYFKMIEQSIRKLDDSLQEMLEYAKNTNGKAVVQRVDIRSLIDENLAAMAYMQGASHIRKKVEVNNEAILYSDQHQISIILNNLISNAFKYYDSTKEDPCLDIKVDITNEAMQLVFNDNGIGIDKEYLDHVFDMFFRATAAEAGTGIGLYLVQEAVHKLKGTIKVESELGKGTTFTIQLPNFNS